MVYKKIWLALVVVISMLVIPILAACATPAPEPTSPTPAPTPTPSAPTPTPTTPPEHEMVNGVIYSCPFGSNVYLMGNAGAEIINKHHSWIRLSNVETLGGADDVKLTGLMSPEGKKYVLPMPSAPNFWTARDGTTPYDQAYPDLRWIAAVGALTSPLFITLDPEIRTIYDIPGHTLGTGPRLWGAGVTANGFLEAAGILDEIEQQEFALADLGSALKDGLVDVVVAYDLSGPEGYVLPSVYEEVRVTTKLYYLDVPAEIRPKAEEILGMPFPSEIVPANQPGLGNDEPISLFTLTAYAYACWADTDDEFVYEIVKCFAENYEDWELYVPSLGGALKAAGPEFYSSRLPIRTEADIHPAALRYYKEQGWKIGS